MRSENKFRQNVILNKYSFFEQVIVDMSMRKFSKEKYSFSVTEQFLNWTFIYGVCYAKFECSI